LTVLVPYFVMLGLQILSEILHYWFHSIVGDGTQPACTASGSCILDTWSPERS